MDNEKQVLNHSKRSEDIETVTGSGILRSSDQTVAPSLEEPISRSADTHRCRECLGAMAHRLAQPMTALRGGIELGLMGKRTVTDYRALLEQSLQVADSMVQMIDSLREIGEAGARGGTAQNVPLRDVVQEVMNEMEGVARSRNLRLELNSGGAPEVAADPERLRDVFQSLLAWVIQNCACGGPIVVKISEAAAMAQVHILPPRLDLQYLQIKMLAEITIPGLLFSQAAKNGALGWAIIQRLLDVLGGKLEMLFPSPESSCICVSLPLAMRR